MDKQVFALLQRINVGFGISGITLLCFAVSFALFLTCLLLTLLKRGYGIKKRLWFILGVVFVLMVDLAFTLHLGSSAFFPLLLLSFDVLGVGIIFLLPQRQGVYSKESLSLAEFLSKKAREQQSGDAPVYRAEIERIQAGGGEVVSENGNASLRQNQRKTQADLELDFTHVKNVIERLNCFGLSQADKRQVKELEALLSKAESGESDDKTKESINDGLSALLKIMSKYGV